MNRRSTTFNDEPENPIGASFELPTVKWEWDFFGNGSFTISLCKDATRWQRFITRVFLGSKWKRVLP